MRNHIFFSYAMFNITYTASSVIVTLEETSENRMTLLREEGQIDLLDVELQNNPKSTSFDEEMLSRYDSSQESIVGNPCFDYKSQATTGPDDTNEHVP
jgi:hypothetical protein